METEPRGTESAAPQEFSTWWTKTGKAKFGSKQAFADALGVARVTVARWARLKSPCSPSSTHYEALYRETLLDCFGPTQATAASKAERTHRSTAIKKSWDESTPEARARRLAASQKACSKPEIRTHINAAIKEAHSRPEMRDRKSAAMKKVNADPEVRARISARSKKAWDNSEYRTRTSSAIKKAKSTPEARARQSALSKEIHSRPDVRARKSDAMKKAATPEVRAHKSAVMKKRWEELARLRQLAAQQPPTTTIGQQPRKEAAGKGEPRKHGPSKVPYQETESYKTGKEVQRLIDSGMKQSEARHTLADSTHRQYSSVELYHKEFRSWLRKNP